MVIILHIILYVYSIYVHIIYCVYTIHIYVCIYIYIERERERERKCIFVGGSSKKKIYIFREIPHNYTVFLH